MSTTMGTGDAPAAAPEGIDPDARPLGPETWTVDALASFLNAFADDCPAHVRPAMRGAATRLRALDGGPTSASPTAPDTVGIVAEPDVGVHAACETSIIVACGAMIHGSWIAGHERITAADFAECRVACPACVRALAAEMTEARSIDGGPHAE